VTGDPPRVLLTVEAAADRLAIGRTSMFALVKSGAVKSVLVGRCRRVPLDELDAYVVRLTERATERTV
jgi:excisionase family DNA binding protein